MCGVAANGAGRPPCLVFSTVLAHRAANSGSEELMSTTSMGNRTSTPSHGVSLRGPPSTTATVTAAVTLSRSHQDEYPYIHRVCRLAACLPLPRRQLDGELT